MDDAVLPRIVLASLIVPAALSAAEDAWRFVDPSYKMLMGIHWRQIKESSAGTRFRQELRDNLPLPSLPGFDIFSNVNHVLVASTGASGGNQQTPVLIVVSGQFDLAKVKAAVRKKGRRAVVQNIEIFESPEGHLGVALVSPETLLFGDLPTLVRAVGGGTGAVFDSILIGRARQLDDGNDFWMVSAVNPSGIAGQSMPVPLPLSMQEVQSMELGVRLRDGVELSLAMQTSSPEAARKLKSEMTRTVQLAAKEKNRPDLTGLDKFLKVAAVNDTVRVTFQLDSANLENRMRSYQTRRRPPVPPVVASAPPNPPGTKPVIWNADSPEKR